MKTLFLTTLLLLTSSVFASGMAKYKCVLPAVHEWEEESVFYISQSEEFMCGNRDADASLAVMSSAEGGIPETQIFRTKEIGDKLIYSSIMKNSEGRSLVTMEMSSVEMVNIKYTLKADVPEGDLFPGEEKPADIHGTCELFIMVEVDCDLMP